MLASAVVVPEDTPSESGPSLKRRQSSISSETSKRPRLHTDNSYQSSHGSPTQSATVMSPPPARRKMSALGVDSVEEKKRGQRLFGGLLGTLSQTSAKPAHRKRDEIEKRQQEKIRQKDEELAEEKRRKREQIESIRREDQKVWDEQSVSASRHSKWNMVLTDSRCAYGIRTCGQWHIF
jgi:pinin/SDK/memA/ protein conserved region